MKIYQSELGVKSPSVPQVGALGIPLELAVQFGGAVSKLGQSISDIRNRRQATQDENEARKIIKEIDPIIKEKFKSFENSTDIGAITNFYKATDFKNFKENLRWKNKEVKKKVSKYIFDEQIQLGDKLYTTITVNHGAETKAVHDDQLRQIKFKMSANDGNTRGFGYKDYVSWFNNPLNKEKYTDAEFAILKRDTLAEARQLQLMFRTKNNPMEFLKNIDKILEDFPEFDNKDSKRILTKAAADSFVSKQIANDFDEVQAEKANTTQKIYNFAEVVKRLNNKNDPDYLLKIPTLDDIADLLKMDQINSMQHAALVEFYSNENKVSDDRVIDMINAQLAVAKSTEDIDILERQINFDQEFMLKLNIYDYAGFKEIFDKYKGDQPGLLQNGHFLDKLRTNLGKIENSVGYSLGKSQSEGKNQLTRIDGLKMYNDLIRNNVAPADAYIQVLDAFKTRITLPTIYEVVQPTSIKILEPPDENAMKDPAKWFEDKRIEVLEKFKQGLDHDTFKRDLDAIDVIEDYFKVRQSIGKTAFAFDASQSLTSEAETGK